MSRNSKAKRDKKVRSQKKGKPSQNHNKLSQKLKSERIEYSDQWTNANAAHFEAGGHYKWMADFVTGYNKILEIGTGGGHGTLELAKRGHKIISIEENLTILDSAEEYLTKNGITCTRIRREHVLIGNDTYKISYRPILEADNDDSYQVLLVEGDMLNDPSLFNWLRKEAPFDAVVCWLMGTHGARIYNDAIKARRIPTPGEYRLHVQNPVYDLADEILRSNGRLHIVDRTQEPDREEIRTDFLDAHKDQASVTNIIVDSLDYIVYEEPSTENKVEMCITVGLSGKIPAFTKMAFSSTCSHKP